MIGEWVELAASPSVRLRATPLAQWRHDRMDENGGGVWMVVCVGASTSAVRTAIDAIGQELPDHRLALLKGAEPGGRHERWLLRRARVVAPADTTPERLADLMAISEAMNAKIVAGGGTAWSDHALAALSTRELDVLDLITEGMPNSAIAKALAISRHTVQFHVGNILRKLDARTRAEAAAKAVESAM